MAKVARCVAVAPSMKIVNRAKSQESAGESEQKALERHDSRVSKAVDKQMGRARKKFKQMDVDGNGVLDRDELLNLADWVFSSFTPGGKKLSEEEKDMEVARIMQSADSDGDGLMDFEEFEEWFRVTAKGIYEKQRQEAARKRAIERERAQAEAEAAHIQADRERAEKREERFKELLFAVRQEIVVSLGLKSKKYRQILPEIEAIDTIEKLGDFCRAQVRYLPNFDISQLNEVRDAKHLLGEMKILSHLNALELDKLSSLLRPCDFEDEQFVMREGEDGSEMYIIDDGVCDVIIKGKVVAQLDRGRYFGEVALLRDAPRNASIRSKGKTRCLALTRSTFDQFIGPTLRTVFIFEQVPLLAPLSFEDRLSLAKAVVKKTFIGTDIIVQGDPGETMYIITKGEVSVHIQGQGEVARSKMGDWFGEGALMTDAARAATITAVGTVECLELSRETFDDHVFGHMENPHAQAELVLAQVPLLSGIPTKQRSQLAAEMTVANFALGERIISQGEVGDCMYVLETGSVKVEVDGVGEVAQFEEGQAFGEQALMNDAPRGANITALEDCRCLRLSRKQFDEIVVQVLAPVARIEMVLVQVPLLSKLARGKLSRLAQATKSRTYKAGEMIIKEGDTGDSMYIVEEGSCAVSVEGVGEVARKHKGEYFGETALLDDAPRSATIAAVSPEVICLELSRITFEQYVSSSARVELLLSQIPLLAGLDQDTRIELAHKLELESYRHGKSIIKEGEMGDSMFIIEEGECVVNIEGKGDVARLGRGKYFGEASLLSDVPRNATISAAGEVKTFKLGRDTFNALIFDKMAGPAQISLLLAQVPLLSKLDLNQRMRLASLMEEKSFFDGEPIVRIGEAGDCMYIVSEGTAVVSNQGGQQLATLRRGDFFGDLALLNNKPRAANVSAASMSGSTTSGVVVSTKCLKLRRDDFMKLVAGDLDRRTAPIELLLAQVPLMEGLAADRRAALAKVMVSKAFRGGDVIMKQGDEGDRMYIIESGEANVNVDGVGTVAVKSRGDWFGETALLHGSKRTASVVSKGNCKCLELGRDAFNEHVLDVMGPLARIELWLAQVPLLNNLEPGKRLQLAEQMRRRELNDGDEVMHQGDLGESMFVIEAGDCGIWVEDEYGLREVATLTRGQFFGEQALVNNAARTASVLAKGDGCICLELTRGRFEKSITEHIERLLAQVPLLTSLDPAKRSWLAKGMVLRSYAPGDTIIREKDSGECFYIIEQGECVVTTMSNGEVNRLHRGDFFGELALLRDAKRNASIWAGTDVRVLELARPDFDRLIGPLAVQGGLNVRDVLGLGFDELLRAALQFVYLKRWDAATEAFRKCHELHPSDPIVLYNLAAIGATEGNADATLTWLDKAVNTGLTYDDVRDDIDVMGLFGLVAQEPRFQQIWQQLQNPGIATRKNLTTPEQLMRMAQERETAEQDAKWDELNDEGSRAIARATKQGYVEAVASFEGCLEVRPENPSNAYSLCTCYSFLRKPEEAMKWLKLSIAWGLAAEKDQPQSAFTVLTEVKTFQAFGGLREQPEFVQVRNILRRQCRKRAGKKRACGRRHRERRRARKAWLSEVVWDCVDDALEVAEDTVFIRNEIVLDVLLPAAMDSVEERGLLKEQAAQYMEAQAGMTPSQAEAALLAQGDDDDDPEGFLLDSAQGANLRTIDELMESDWMEGGGSGGGKSRAGLRADEQDETGGVKHSSSSSSSSNKDDAGALGLRAGGDLMTIFEIRDELRGRLGIGISDAHELTVYLSELAGASDVGGGYQEVSTSDEFVEAVEANGGGIEPKFCRRIFASLRHAAEQREAKERRQRAHEAREAAEALAAEKAAASSPIGSLSVSGGAQQRPKLSGAAMGPGRWRNVIKNELPMDVARWSFGDMRKWLEELGLPEYSEQFEKFCLAGERLLQANSADLAKAGVSVLGHRKLMLKALKALAYRRKLSDMPPSGHTPESTPGNSRGTTPRESFHFTEKAGGGGAGGAGGGDTPLSTPGGGTTSLVGSNSTHGYDEPAFHFFSETSMFLRPSASVPPPPLQQQRQRQQPEEGAETTGEF
jgi:CRP-like cAMP-binding protein